MLRGLETRGDPLPPRGLLLARGDRALVGLTVQRPERPLEGCTEADADPWTGVDGRELSRTRSPYLAGEGGMCPFPQRGLDLMESNGVGVARVPVDLWGAGAAARDQPGAPLTQGPQTLHRGTGDEVNGAPSTASLGFRGHSATWAGVTTAEQQLFTPRQLAMCRTTGA